ncbi:MAG: GDSL-type esterase/lipase family protein [Cyanobacteria bacterium]|nr:GDSL-type esterase/lipase family protein [Cyanobacteriota bacterium]
MFRFSLRTLTLLGLGVFCIGCNPSARLAARSDLIFVGDSITAAGPWVAAFPNRRVVNAAVPGYTSVDMVAQLPSLRRDQPHTYVLMAGINDLLQGARAESVAQRLALMRQALATPGQRLIQVSTLPCQIRSCGAAALAEVDQLNRLLRRQTPAADFLDLTPDFLDAQGLRPAFSSDGLHLNRAGYGQWLRRLRPLLEG